MDTLIAVLFLPLAKLLIEVLVWYLNRPTQREDDGAR